MHGNIIDFLGGYQTLKSLYDSNAASVYLPDINQRIVLSNYDVPEILRNYRIEHNLFDITDIVVDEVRRFNKPFTIEYIENDVAYGKEQNGRPRIQTLKNLRHATIEERLKNKVIEI